MYKSRIHTKVQLANLVFSRYTFTFVDALGLYFSLSFVVEITGLIVVI